MQLEQAREQAARRLLRQRARLRERDGVRDVGQREVVCEPRGGAQLVRIRGLHELVGRAAREPSARAEIAAVSHAEPVYAGPPPRTSERWDTPSHALLLCAQLG